MTAPLIHSLSSTPIALPPLVRHYHQLNGLKILSRTVPRDYSAFLLHGLLTEDLLIFATIGGEQSPCVQLYLTGCKIYLYFKMARKRFCSVADGLTAALSSLSP